jgi:hypothetical protein
MGPKEVGTCTERRCGMDDSCVQKVKRVENAIMRCTREGQMWEVQFQLWTSTIKQRDTRVLQLHKLHLENRVSNL